MEISRLVRDDTRTRDRSDGPGLRPELNLRAQRRRALRTLKLSPLSFSNETYQAIDVLKIPRVGIFAAQKKASMYNLLLWCSSLDFLAGSWA